MASMEQPQVIHAIREATGESFGLQSKIERRSGLGNGLSLYFDKGGEIEQTIRNYVNVTYSHLAKLETRLNMLTAINRLPPEVLTHIILFAYRPGSETRHPYMLYTWVCRHWRSILIRDVNLWRLIRFESKSKAKDNRANSVFGEIIQRSKSAALDVEIIDQSTQLLSMPETFFGLTNRIRRLWLLDCNSRIISLLSDQTFSSLQGVQYGGDSSHWFLVSLPVLVGLEHLETLQYILSETPSTAGARNQLASVFGRIRNLYITILCSRAAQSTLELLHNNSNLQNLRIVFKHSGSGIEYINQITLSELQFLATNNLRRLKFLRAPKLSSLDANFCLPTHSVLEEFDLSSFRYLYVMDQSMIGAKEGIGTQSLFPIKYANAVQLFNSTQDCFSTAEFLSDPFPRDCFRVRFDSKNTLVQALFSILPRMKGITDLHLLVDTKGSKTFFTKVVTMIPSVEKLLISHNCKPKDYIIRHLRDPCLCPNLKQLSLVGRTPHRPESKTLNSIGKLLYQCLQARGGLCGNTLKYVTLEISRPLPDDWTNELRKRGMTVVTVK